MRYVVLAWILLLRGKLDEAEPLLAEATRYLEGNQEPQLQLGPQRGVRRRREGSGR